MSDDEGLPVIRTADPDQDPDLLLYDYSKYLLTLSLLVLGGVLSLTQGAGGAKIGPQVLVVVVFLALSGMLSLSCANGVVRARTGMRPRSAWTHSLNQGAMFFLGGGVGAFLFIWTEALL